MTRLVATLAALLLAAVIPSLSVSPAAAASFDCAKARTKVETLICKDPQLSRQDEDLAKAYGEALKLWDGKIAAYVRISQRGWMGARALETPGMSGGGILCEDDETALSCLRTIHADRIAVLRNPGFRLSGIYTRGQDFLSVKATPTGLELAYQLADANTSQGFTDDGAKVKVVPGQTIVAFPLAGTGPDACRLDASFSVGEVTVTQKGPCGGAKLGGWWKRDQTRDPEAELF
ncbi:lysozyme inhibitor LprI family protein [Caulobacter sp. Root1472]|jgi:uncharacterized protein YecT (DUF1311 family)|uniref:lysozyme inhibitor LprI family protein n=1 Tax=Caulobacter sp. Root1472 TaxID=1736470 RepID=UPI0006F4401E|nr:hypothetical protein [Caulobacter sp. Root1472]KQZ31377.1 hypothetical protein ASD47_16165 [Caulobacter sp. Root1472]